ncbi:hypothetical protein MMC13_004462 [Lambiella insularis]|nr:hypothetical protein [Lambiella insularis]
MPNLTQEELHRNVEKLRHAILSKINITTVSDRQRNSLRDTGIGGPVWVIQTTLPAPETEKGDCFQLIRDAILALSQGEETYHRPDVLDVHAEWTGHHTKVKHTTPETSLPQSEKFNHLMKDITASTTILYLHGGAFFPAMYRGITVKLAQLTKGRCLAVRYRLAPQNPFPAALLDCLIAYLSLLYPPPGSYHSPVSASSIILAGDSSGAALALGLIQIILAARHNQGTSTPTVRFHNRTVQLLMPGGATMQSPSMDQTYSSLPSWTRNAPYDVLQEDTPALLPDYPPCSIWPSNPPRGDVYCETSMICHPLVSPATALDWRGAPPMWFGMGEERLSDAAKVVAQAAVRQGVIVQWEEYKRMPHNWPMLFPRWWQAARCLEHWAAACNLFSGASGLLQNRGESIDWDGRTKEVDVRNLTELTTATVIQCMKAKQETMKPWTGKGATKSMM